MRIGLTIAEFDPHRGGAEAWTSQYAENLARRGHEVHVLAAKFDNRAARSRVTVHAVPAARSRLALAKTFDDILASFHLDVIHDMGVGCHCDVFQPHGGSRAAATRQNLLKLPAWRAGWKQVFDAISPRHREFKRLDRQQYARDGRVWIALSQMVAEDFQRLHEVSHADIRLVYNGVDVERFSPHQAVQQRDEIRARLTAHDKLVLLLVAHNFELKGVPAAIRATGRLRKLGLPAQLVIVGGKKTPARYQKLAASAGAEGAVTFVGAVRDSLPYYGAADIYLHPTWYDPCSLVVLEALACGLPVITTRYNGAGELICPGQEGFVLQHPNDVETIVRHVLDMNDVERRDQMSKLARALALEHTLERNVGEMEAVYEERGQQRRAA
ncbi:MAG: glycosyltransferase family 4 protein [Pirellulales bacterium]|nr:glycosyltransferase family 4 protein [Pirellulales bacterium]